MPTNNPHPKTPLSEMLEQVAASRGGGGEGGGGGGGGRGGEQTSPPGSPTDPKRHASMLEELRTSARQAEIKSEAARRVMKLVETQDGHQYQKARYTLERAEDAERAAQNALTVYLRAQKLYNGRINTLLSEVDRLKGTNSPGGKGPRDLHYWYGCVQCQRQVQEYETLLERKETSGDTDASSFSPMRRPYTSPSRGPAEATAALSSRRRRVQPSPRDVLRPSATPPLSPALRYFPNRLARTPQFEPTPVGSRAAFDGSTVSGRSSSPSVNSPSNRLFTL